MGDQWRTSNADYGAAYTTKATTSQSHHRTSPQNQQSQRDTHHHHGHQDHQSSRHGSQMQAQKQTLRSAQASKQMVYDVFGNTLTMLEELEQRELREQGGRSLDRSDIHLPSQSAFDTATVKRKIDTQLLLLQSQLESCDKEILESVKDDLRRHTLNWSSQRQANGVQKGKTDKYAGKLFEVLAKGKTTHPKDFNKTPSIGERDIQNAMDGYMKGNHIRNNLDRDFRNNPSKQAEAPRVRAGAGTNLGVERMMEVRPDMKTAINMYRTNDLK